MRIHIEPGERLVQKNELRIVKKSGADENLLTHSLGIGLQAPQPVLREIEAFEHALDPSLKRFLFDVVKAA